MIRSAQNITATLLILSCIALVSSCLITVTNCPNPSNCLALASFYKLDFDSNLNISQSTPIKPEIKPEVTFSEIVEATQVISTYSLLAAVIIMVALEALELRYLKLFLSSKKRRPTVSRR